MQVNLQTSLKRTEKWPASYELGRSDISRKVDPRLVERKDFRAWNYDEFRVFETRSPNWQPFFRYTKPLCQVTQGWKPMSVEPQPSNLTWHATQRWLQFEGEARANLIRIAAIGTFYLIHLWHYFSSQGKLPNWLPSWLDLQQGDPSEVSQRFHVMVTCLAVSWVMLAASVNMALQNRFFPRWLPVATLLGDVLFLTSVLCIAGGPRSPLVVGYFLILALATLRFNLSLIRLATFATMLGYLVVLGSAKWPTLFGHPAELDLTVSRFFQFVTLAALALTGITSGQVIRRIHALIEGKHDG